MRRPPAGIVLLPHPEHAADLLSVGPCGGRPPSICHRQKAWRPNFASIDPDTDGLVLAWGGKLLEPGCFRLGWTGFPETCRLVSRVLLDVRGAAQDLADHLSEMGTVLLLDRRGGVVGRYAGKPRPKMRQEVLSG